MKNIVAVMISGFTVSVKSLASYMAVARKYLSKCTHSSLISHSASLIPPRSLKIIEINFLLTVCPTNRMSGILKLVQLPCYQLDQVLVNIHYLCKTYISCFGFWIFYDHVNVQTAWLLSTRSNWRVVFFFLASFYQVQN